MNARSWLVLAGGLVVEGALLGHSIRANSAVFDEGMHLAAGYRYWQCGDYGINPEHPPLVKLLAASPVRRWSFDAFDRPCGEKLTKNEDLLGVGYRLINGPRGDEALVTARTVTLVIPLALVAAVFFTAHIWFGPTAAMLAVLLVVFEPNLLAHGPLVTTDAALTLATLLAAAGAWRYAERPSAARLLGLGLAVGLALASKHSGLLVPVIVGLELALLGAARRRPARPLIVGWVLACAIGVVVLWATYGFRFAALPPGAPEGVDLPRTGVIGLLARGRLLPESYLAGLVYVREHAAREAYFFGRQLTSGVWYYFPVALSIKTTLPLVVLVAVALRRRSVAEGALLLPVALFLAAAMASGMNIGVRHVLPVYPFLVLLAAGTAAEAARRSRAGAVLVAVLLAAHAGSSLAAHPNHIAYANEAWGGPGRLHHYLGDSNVDWGQSLYQVRDYLARHEVGECWIAWFGMRKPSEVGGIPCGTLPGPMFLEAADRALPPLAPESFSGTVLVSATLTEYDLYPYAAFRGRTPIDVIGGSVLVYRGAFHLPEVAAERRGARGWWLLKHGRVDEAIAELKVASRSSRSPIVASLLAALAPER